MDGHIFKITGVSREDLLELFPQSKKKIERLSDADMDHEAEEIGVSARLYHEDGAEFMTMTGVSQLEKPVL